MELPFFPIVGVYNLGEVLLPTSSKPHYLRVHERKGASFWVGKCADICPDPYTTLKEYICYRLAKLFDLPVPDYYILKDGERYWSAVSLVRPTDVFLERYFLQAENANVIPDMLAFSVLVANTDLHEGNILLQRITDEPLRHRIWMIDFSHALYEFTDREGAYFPQDLTVYECLRLDVANGLITGIQDFEPFLQRLLLATKEQIFEVVASIPREIIKYDVDRGELAKYIVDRQSNLRNMLTSAKNCFPNWK
ncbi:MAG: hypothetical protein AMJ37_04610 [Dehalococcoidia bacterium DG_18]|nr:MAG: hypothetical protein AMJ37_04610 [Dehalococcoidia bacterium DG_18]